MHPALFGIALGLQLLTPVSDQVPRLNVEATCKASVQADKDMELALPQSFEKCMSDENEARKQLLPIWSSYSVAIQTRCHDEAIAGGNESYVDMLVCMQMTDGSKSTTGANLRGASKRQPPN